MNKQLTEKSRYNIIYEAFQSCADEEIVVKLFNDWFAESGRMFVPLTSMEHWEEACEKYNIQGKHIDIFRKCDDYFYGMDDWVSSEEYLSYIFEYSCAGVYCVKYYSKLPDSQFIKVLESLKYRDIDKIKEQLVKADERYTEIKDIWCERGNDLKLFVKWYNNYLSNSHSAEIPLTEFTKENWEKAVDTYNISAKKIKIFCYRHSFFYSRDGYIYTIDPTLSPWTLSYQEFEDCARWYAETTQTYNDCLKLLGVEKKKPAPAKLLKYCFCSKEHGNCTKEEIVALVEKTDKPFVYTYGLSYRNPTTHRKPISKDEAISLVKTKGMIDITEETEVIHIEEFSENDMW